MLDGQSSVTFEDLNLNKNGGTITAAVQGDHKKLSAKVEVSYTGEGKTDAYTNDFEGADYGVWTNGEGTSDIALAEAMGSKNLQFTSFGRYTNPQILHAIVHDTKAPGKYDAILSMDVMLAEQSGTTDGNIGFITRFKDVYNYVDISVDKNGNWTYEVQKDDVVVNRGTIATGVPFKQGVVNNVRIAYSDDDYVLFLNGATISQFTISGTAEMFGSFAVKPFGDTNAAIANRDRAVHVDNIVFENYKEIMPPILTVKDNVLNENNATRGSVTLQSDKRVKFVVNGIEDTIFRTSLTFKDEGAYTVKAVDADGNASQTLAFLIDRTRPEIKADVPHLGATNQDVTFTANEAVQFVVNGEAKTGFVTEFVLASEGVNSVIAYDKAGNRTPIYRVTIKKAAPVLTGIPENGFSASAVTLTSDVRVQYTINGTLASEEYVYRLRIVDEGEYTVTATDSYGNATTVQFVIDRTKPALSSEQVAHNGKTNQDVTINANEPVTLTINDRPLSDFLPAGDENICLGKNITSNNGYVGSNATDGNYDTYWANGVAEDQWVQLDMGADKTVSRWVVSGFGGAYNLRDFRLQYSADGENWNDADVITGNTAQKLERTLVQPVTARYFRIYIDLGCQDPSYSFSVVNEWEMYGPAAEEYVESYT
ncbi:MAG: discoidin domain-containing protein, partial [Oscillospiraceae bacterium]